MNVSVKRIAKLVIVIIDVNRFILLQIVFILLYLSKFISMQYIILKENIKSKKCNFLKNENQFL
jgi:hypothetical protein